MLAARASFDFTSSVEKHGRSLQIQYKALHHLTCFLSEQVSFTVEPIRSSLATTLSIRLDEFPSETGWSIACNGNPLASFSTWSYAVSFENITTTHLVAVCASCILTSEDSNGLCCENGEGFYRLYVGESVENGTLFGEGGVFNSTEKFHFLVEQDQAVVV
jgi:hypothetical protein